MKKILITIILYALLISDAYSQCCSAGNPLGGDGTQESINKNELMVFTSFKHSLSLQYYHLDSEYNLSNIEKSYYNYQNLAISYGLFSRLSFYGELGYFYDKTQVININGKETIIQSSGLGDLNLRFRYQVINTEEPISQLVISGGLKLPLGAFHEELNGAMVPISLQPSSGAMKFNAGIYYSRKPADRKFGWNTFLLFETSNTIEEAYLVYKYGNLLQYSLAATYQFNKKMNLIINSKFEWRAHDKRENETLIESTGSKVIYFNPQIIYHFIPGWSALLICDLPIYKYVNGYQLTNHYSLQLGVRKNINFSN